MRDLVLFITATDKLACITYRVMSIEFRDWWPKAALEPLTGIAFIGLGVRLALGRRAAQ